MRFAFIAPLFAVEIPVSAVAQPPTGEVFPRVVNGIEYQLRYGRNSLLPGWQDGMRFEFSREECVRRLMGAENMVCMIRPEATSL